MERGKANKYKSSAVDGGGKGDCVPSTSWVFVILWASDTMEVTCCMTQNILLRYEQRHLSGKLLSRDEVSQEAPDMVPAYNLLKAV